MTELWPNVHRIDLDGVNVYAVVDHGVTLIGAGPASSRSALVDSLRELGYSPADVGRVVANSWHPDCLGGAREFPRADLLVFSPDLKAPRDWEAGLSAHRELRRRVGNDLIEAGAEWTSDQLESWLAEAYPRGTSKLSFTPMRPGHRVRAGGLTLDVVDGAGLGAGNCVLHEAERSIAFVAELELDGLPLVEGEVRDYLLAADRITQLSADWIAPLRREPTDHGRWTMKRVSRFLSNYLSNASSMLVKSRSLMEIATADIGDKPQSIGAHIEAVLRHGPFLEELVRSGVLGADGDGLERRYTAL